MRKTKLLLVAFLAMLGLSSQAQTWTPAEVEEGEFLLYNVGKGQYFTRGNGWGTQASMTEGEDEDAMAAAMKVELVAEGDYYLMRTLVYENPTWGVECLNANDIYTDQSRGKNSSWEFVNIGTTSDPVYNIISRDNHSGPSGIYITANEENTVLAPGDDGETEYAQWKLCLIKTKAEKLYEPYQNVKDAILAISSSINLRDADAKASTATTSEEIDEAVALARKALADYLTTLEDVVIDITGAFVTNPSFENGTTGWTYQTSNDHGAKPNSNATYTVDNADGDYVFNIWSSGNAISQTITDLPNGNYKMMALIATDAGHQVQLNANTESVIVDAAEEGKGHGVDGEVEFSVLDGTATIGAEGVDKYWYKVDNFRLYFLGALTDLTPYAERLAEVAGEASAIEQGTIPAAMYTVLKTAIDDYYTNKVWSSVEDYEEAIAAIEEATNAAKALIAPYATFLEMKAIAEELAAANSDNAAGKADLVDAISTQSTNVEAAVGAEEIETATADLKGEMSYYANSSNPVGEGEKFNMTFMLTNPDLTNVPGWAPAEGWYNDQTQPTQNSQVMNSNNAVANSADPTKFAMYEYWSAGTEPTEGYVVYQKITLPEGTYKMTALAFAGFGGGHRYGYQTDGDHGLGPLGDGSPNITFSAGEIDGTPITTPTLEDASIDFVQEVEGEVKIGLKAHAGNRSNWMGIGYVQLFKVQSVEIEIDEDVAFEPESVAGKVSLKRTLNEGKWNTFAVPFSITNEELIDAFGEGTEVAEFSETLATEITENEAGEEVETPIENESIISFDKMETPAITANRPVLLKPASVDANGEYVFYNRTVAAGFPFVAGLNFEFVGNYAGEITLEEGDYFLNGGKIYESNGTNNLKGTCAYITAKAEGARIAGFFIDGVSEDATAIEGLQINSDFAGKLYNLNGQQVKSAKKGLYIREGKKVVVK